MPDPFAHGLPTVDGARLRLRHPRDPDAPDILAVFGDPQALRYWSHGPLADLEAARAYLADIDAGWRDRSLFQWGIADRETDRLIGTVTLTSWDRDNRHAEIGFILHPSRQGVGLASEAVRTVLTFGFGPMGLHRVEADVDPANEGSIRLLERIGFQREGTFRERWWVFETWKDSAMFGLLASDFASSRTEG
ncbi:MAG: GNAT family protein [Bacteroidota bacterium]